MITCPKCNEVNGNTRTTCYKCGAIFSKIDSYKKICRKCKTTYSSRETTCKHCDITLSVLSDNTNTGTDNANNASFNGCALYIVSVLIPLLGIILGCIYIAKNENDYGKSLIFTSVVAIILWGMLFVL